MKTTNTKDFFRKLEKNETFAFLDFEVEKIFLQFCPLIKENCNASCVCLKVILEDYKDPNFEDIDLKKVVGFSCQNISLFGTSGDNDFLNTKINLIYKSELNELESNLKHLKDLKK